MLKDIPVLIKLHHKLLNEVLVDGAFGAGVIVKAYTILLEELGDIFVGLICELLGLNASTYSLYLYRCPVLVATAHEYYVLSAEP